MRTRKSLGLVAVLIAATALPLIGAGAASARTTPHVIPPCGNGQVVNWLNTAANGAAGTIYYQVQFTNTSTVECTLSGYPGVSAVNRAGHQIGAAARRVGPLSVLVYLKAGATARASLGIVETGNFPASSCKPVTAFGLRVYAPNQTASDVIPFPFSTCSKSTDVSLTIGVVRK